jgi:hypothetical protein
LKSQKYNQGPLKALNINIDAEVVNTLEQMSKQTKLNLEDLVVTALKRFISSHSDYIDDRPVEHHLNKK